MRGNSSRKHFDGVLLLVEDCSCRLKNIPCIAVVIDCLDCLL